MRPVTIAAIAGENMCTSAAEIASSVGHVRHASKAWFHSVVCLICRSANNWHMKLARVVLVAAAALGCGNRFDSPPLPLFPVVIRADSDPGVPLAGATVSRK